MQEIGGTELDGSESREVALPLLVEAHGGRLYSLGLRFCGNAQEAEDLVQETFLQAFRHWDQFAGRSKVSTWLYTIASRVCQRFHRKKSGEPEHVDSLDELLPFGESRMAVVPDTHGEDDPLGMSMREEGRAQLEQAIIELPLDFRMPLVLKEIAGFSLAEVAGVLDLKEATVKTRLHRARLRLRKALEEALPRAEVPATIYSSQVCLDLLQAKQETLDRGLAFEFPDQMVCERCSKLFETMDLTQELCHEIARGELPDVLRETLLAEFRS
ncbi:MAG: RNA polymerase sigma-70 factor (ECF subfamily) [Gammaproteobacteria bacterium]|jgi:RNA polymerase sigma-70 factor (ECF subfamily)